MTRVPTIPLNEAAADQPPDPAAAALRIGEAIAPMIRLVDAHGYTMLAYLLELAKNEADQQAGSPEKARQA